MRHPREQGALESAHELTSRVQVVVPYTDIEMTRRALESAAALAVGLASTVHLVAIHVVPFPAPLRCPESVRSFLTDQLSTLASEAGGSAEATLVLAREWEAGYRQAVAPGAAVVIAVRRRWWPTRERRLAKILAKLGCEVVTVEV
jgi:hypothetical protein